jgi:drug/metabolite transporter (DMT)-like permease
MPVRIKRPGYFSNPESRHQKRIFPKMTLFVKNQPCYRRSSPHIDNFYHLCYFDIIMSKKNLYPEIIVALAAAVWGLFWIPLRAFETHGLAPAWTTLIQFVAPLIMMTPFAIRRVLHRKPTGIEQYGTGLLIGSAFTLYCGSLLLTDVVRALVLFYMMPAWGTLIEIGLLGRRFTTGRVIALSLSLSGLLAILGVIDSLSVQINMGDLMALLSGILFTAGATRVRQAQEVSVFEQVFAFFFFGTIAAISFSMLPLTALGQPPSLMQLIELAPWIVMMALVFLIPVMWWLYWGSRHVDPGRLGFLLQLEAVVGIISAALLAGEPFGWRETTGAVLVIGAGLVEMMNRNSGHTSRMTNNGYKMNPYPPTAEETSSCSNRE